MVFGGIVVVYVVVLTDVDVVVLIMSLVVTEVTTEVVNSTSVVVYLRVAVVVYVSGTVTGNDTREVETMVDAGNVFV